MTVLFYIVLHYIVQFLIAVTLLHCIYSVSDICIQPDEGQVRVTETCSWFGYLSYTYNTVVLWL